MRLDMGLKLSSRNQADREVGSFGIWANLPPMAISYWMTRRLHMMQSDLGDQYTGKFVIT